MAIKENRENFTKSKDGHVYKYPDRSCKTCSKYPCMDNHENRECDYAKYGCVQYVKCDK